MKTAQTTFKDDSKWLQDQHIQLTLHGFSYLLNRYVKWLSMFLDILKLDEIMRTK